MEQDGARIPGKQEDEQEEEDEYSSISTWLYEWGTKQKCIIWDLKHIIRTRYITYGYIYIKALFWSW